MKAITLTQPWAWSIVHAGKRIENRSRRDGRMPDICRHRGPLLLHAAKGMKISDYEKAVSFMVGRQLARTKYGRGDLPVIPPRLQDVGDDWLPLGIIVGRCRAIGVIAPSARGASIEIGDRYYETTRIDETVRLDAHDMTLDLRWWMGGYALVLVDVEPTKWVPARGMLGCWTVPNDVLERLGVAT